MQQASASVLLLVVLWAATGPTVAQSDPGSISLTRLEPTEAEPGVPLEIHVRGAGFTPETQALLVEGSGAHSLGEMRPVFVEGQAEYPRLLTSGPPWGRPCTLPDCGFFVYDIQNPFRPILLSSLPVRGRLLARHHQAYLLDGKALHVVDIDDSGYARLVATLDGYYSFNYESFFWRYDMAYKDGYLYANVTQFDPDWRSNPHSLSVIDVRNPVNPIVADHFGYPREADPTSLSMDNNILAVFYEGRGVPPDPETMTVVFYDVSDPAHPRELSQVPVEHQIRPHQVRLTGNTCWLTHYDGWLYQIDISDPSNPVMLNTRRTPYGSWGLDAFSDRLHLNTGGGGFTILRPRTPDPPIQVMRINRPDDSNWVVGSHIVPTALDTAYVPSIGGTLFAYHFETPPVSTNMPPDPDPGESLAVESETAYAIDRRHDVLSIMDILDSEKSLTMGEISPDSSPILKSRPDLSPYGVRSAAGGRISVGSQPEASAIVNPDDPTSQAPEDALTLPYPIMCSYLAEDLLYVGTEGGLYIVDVSNQVPAVIGQLGLPLLRCSSITLNGEIAVVSGWLEITNWLDDGQITIDNRLVGQFFINVASTAAPRLAGVDGHLSGVAVTRAMPRSAGTSSATFVSSHELLLRAPDGRSEGPYHVLVWNPDGNMAMLPNAFHVEVDGDGDGWRRGLDCDDEDGSIHPLATEECDGIDQDCDGLIDEDFDRDGDGVLACEGDCDDSTPLVRPGLWDIPGNALDEDCDGVVLCPPDGARSTRSDMAFCVRECLRLQRLGVVTNRECGELISGMAVGP